LWDPKTAGLKRPEEAPEIVAVRGVMDQYRPEVHADLHGIGLQEYAPDQLGARQMYRGQMMTEITGSAYSNYSLRPWDWRVTEAMIAAGREAGFPSDRFEADAQRMLGGGELSGLGTKAWSGSPLFYTAQYAYAKPHTMTLALEVAWEESAVARMRGLLRIGNRTWLDERLSGYPVNRLKNMIGQFVTAYGKTASERRASRVELWNAQERFAVGLLYPQTVGRASLVCAVSEEAKAAMAAGDFAKVRAALPGLIGKDAAEVERFMAAGPEIKLAMDNPPAQPAAAAPIEHGIGFRLRLSYRAPSKLEVRLNGARLTESATDGYEAWFADGFTQVQVNVPPAKARGLGLFFVTCSYEPDVPHRGWVLPAEVREQFRSDVADALPPTIAEAPYGAHFRQTLDLWRSKSGSPTPLLVYLHGGGWAAEDKSNIHQHIDVRAFLDAGISVTAVNYRLLQDASAAGVKLPIEWPIADAARAVQFLRSKAGEWNLDAKRFAATGVSAGAISSLWLAFHDDLADPASSDPVSRQSTRLIAVAGKAPPTSLDPKQMRQWIPNSLFGGHPFGFPLTQSRPETFEQFVAARDSLLPAIRKYSPFELVSADDPPAFLEYPAQDKPPVPGEPQTDPSHTAVFGVKLQEQIRAVGGKSELHYPGAPATEHASLQAFLMEALRK
jgi:acetyl esterase/lipase